MRSLLPQWPERGPLFLRGEFHPLHADTPFAAFHQALGELMQQIFAESPTELEQWQLRVRTVLGNVGGSLVELVPSLTKLVGPQKHVAEMSPRDNESLLTMLQLRLFRAIGRHRPMVVLMDNAQWADEASLRLIAALAQDPPGGNALLLIYAYRPDAVDTGHPLQTVLTKLTQNKVFVKSVAMSPLTADIVQKL